MDSCANCIDLSSYEDVKYHEAIHLIHSQTNLDSIHYHRKETFQNKYADTASDLYFRK